MRTFKDNAGREWAIAITLDAVKRVKAALKIDLLDIRSPRQPGGPPLVMDLQTDVLLLCDAIYVLVQPQAEGRNVNDEEFGRGLTGDAIAAAHQAFMEELADFFRSLPNKQAEAQAVVKTTEMVRAISSRAAQKVDQLAAKAAERASRAIDEISGDPSTASPGPPASTPAR